MKKFRAVLLVLGLLLPAITKAAWPTAFKESCAWIVGERSADYAQFIRRFRSEINQSVRREALPSELAPSRVFTARSQFTGQRFYVVERGAVLSENPTYFYFSDRPELIRDLRRGLSRLFSREFRTGSVETISERQGNFFELSDGRLMELDRSGESVAVRVTDLVAGFENHKKTVWGSASRDLKRLFWEYPEALIQLVRAHQLEFSSITDENLYWVVNVKTGLRFLLLQGTERSGNKTYHYFSMGQSGPAPIVPGNLANIDVRRFGDVFRKEDGSSLVVSSREPLGVVLIPRGSRP